MDKIGWAGPTINKIFVPDKISQLSLLLRFVQNIFELNFWHYVARSAQNRIDFVFETF